MNTTNPNGVKLLATCLLCLVAVPGLAQSQTDVHPMMVDPFILSAGAFLPKTDTSIGLNGAQDNPNPPIDFGGQLDASRSESLFAAELIWRFGKKWSFRGQFFKNGRNSTAVLEQDIQWGDSVLEQGSTITGGRDFEVQRLFFAYNLGHSPKHEYGVGLGVHRLVMGAFLEGDVIINGEVVSGSGKAVSTVAPLPNIGTWYSYSPTEKWLLDARLDWMDAKVGDFSGGLLNIAAGANYQVFRHFGLGLKYQYLRLRLDIDKSDWNGRFNVEYQGMYFYLSANWG